MVAVAGTGQGLRWGWGGQKEATFPPYPSMLFVALLMYFLPPSNLQHLHYDFVGHTEQEESLKKVSRNLLQISS